MLDFDISFRDNKVETLFSSYPAKLFVPDGSTIAYLSTFGGGLVAGDSLVGRITTVDGIGVLTTIGHSLIYGKGSSNLVSYNSYLTPKALSKTSDDSGDDKPPREGRINKLLIKKINNIGLINPARVVVNAIIRPGSFFLLCPQVNNLYPGSALFQETFIDLIWDQSVEEGDILLGSRPLLEFQPQPVSRLPPSLCLLEWTFAADWKSIESFDTILRINIVKDNKKHPFVIEKIQLGLDKDAGLRGYRCFGHCIISGPQTKECIDNLRQLFTATNTPLTKGTNSSTILAFSDISIKLSKDITYEAVCLKFLSLTVSSIADKLNDLCNPLWKVSGGCPFIMR